MTASIAKNPLWYGYVGNESNGPTFQQNRVMPVWSGSTTPMNINLSGLRAGGYQGSLGTPNTGYDMREADQVILNRAGFRGAFSGTDSLSVAGFNDAGWRGMNGLGAGAAAGASAGIAKGAAQQANPATRSPSTNSSTWQSDLGTVGSFISSLTPLIGNIVGAATGNPVNNGSAPGPAANPYVGSAPASGSSDVAAILAAQAQQQAQSAKTMQYVLIGVGGLAVLGVAYAILKK